MKSTCTWCGVQGHTLKECMPHAPVIADENRNAIMALTARASGMKKYVDSSDELAGKVDTLQTLMCTTL